MIDAIHVLDDFSIWGEQCVADYILCFICILDEKKKKTVRNTCNWTSLVFLIPFGFSMSFDLKVVLCIAVYRGIADMSFQGC